MTTEKYIPLHKLEEITNGFSQHSRIGRGGYGDVYKGVYNGREIAVKWLHVDTLRGLDDQEFKNEVGNLLKVKHPNIIQLVGYCYETKKIYVEHHGTNDFSERIYRVLCFEYLQGGSLDKHLYGQSFAPSWSTRYNIIKGICEGLDFLHNCEPKILHLDLKPANILLDNFMEPKVADFGLSRLFTQSHSHVTKKIKGTQKYVPPEFINEGLISPKNDVYSLGVVMIEILTEPAGYSNSFEMGDVAQLSQQVLTKWSTVIESTSKYPLEEIHQVKTCIEVAIRCVDSERENRPSTTYILDALSKTEINIPKRQLAVVPPSLTSGPKNTMENTLKKMTAELDNIANQNRHFSSVPTNSSIVHQVLRETTSDVEESLIIGRTEEKRKIVATLCGSITPEITGGFYHKLSLLSNKFVSNFSKMVNKGFGPRPWAEAQVAQGVGPSLPEITVLPIYGIGGIGKTTLAQLVFNDSQFASHSRVWVYVSQNFDMDKIGKSIISQLSEVSYVTEKQVIHNHLRKLLAGKKILIILDDLWEKNPERIKTLKAMLRLGAGSIVKVIVTTRDEAIARQICHTVEPYKLETLTDKICWKIIKQKTAFKDRVDKEQLKHIGREIATKCGGVALAAQSLGYTLNGKTSDEWESVRENYMWDLSTSEDPSSTNHEVLASLLLSYSHMPDWLKLCFSYCAVFPKGHLIAKYDLIHLWIALGFTEQSSTFDSMQLCENYVTQLLGMSFLQYSKIPSSDGRHDKDVTLLTMHDLVHDLARAILADQVNDKGNAGGNRCRYALLTDWTKPLQLPVTSANIRSLHFLDCRELQLSDDAFSLATCLRVLDLSECHIKWLPESIGRLNQLRFLHAPRIQDQMIPNCITELSELNYLNLRGSDNISALPESIGDMKGLMHLDLSGCNGLYELPTSFTELKQLVHLDLSHCPASISDALPGFSGFTKLQYLNLSRTVSWYKEHRRWLLGFIGNLKKLRYLNLSGCMSMEPSQDQIGSLLDSISTLSNLEHLDLSQNYELSSITESIGNLRKLHTLNISGCLNLKKLPDSVVNMVSLQVLNVDEQVTLDESVLSVLNIASLPHFVVHASRDHKCSSNIICLQPTNPVELTIDRLENVKSAEEARSIKLIEKQKIEKLAYKWTVEAGRCVDDKEVLEKLVPPSSVKALSINGYESVIIPYWLMDIRYHLPNLKEIYLSDFPKCKNLPPLGQLPKLKKLSLRRLEGLEELNTASYMIGKEGVNQPFFPKLDTLIITKCAKLRIKPFLLRARCLNIEDCDNVLSSWGESGSFSPSPINKLTVEKSKVPLHQWKLLRQLPALCSLSISHCSDLTGSPEIIQHLSSLQDLILHSVEMPRWVVELTSLQFLHLSNCRSMTSLPQWLVKLSSLRSLYLSYCNSMTSLPQWLVKLSSLQSLYLSYCNSMTSLPQWLGELASLKYLEIRYCERIRSLPDSIQQLTNLYLHIKDCPALLEWYESEENKMKLTHLRLVDWN